MHLQRYMDSGSTNISDSKVVKKIEKCIAPEGYRQVEEMRRTFYVYFFESK